MPPFPQSAVGAYPWPKSARHPAVGSRHVTRMGDRTMGTNQDADGFSKAKVEGEGFSKRQATEDDVEGHGFARVTGPDDFSKAKVDGEGFVRAKASGEDDVEGHGFARVTGPDDFSKAKT